MDSRWAGPDPSDARSPVHRRRDGYYDDDEDDDEGSGETCQPVWARARNLQRFMCIYTR